MLVGRLVNVIRLSVFANWLLLKLGSYTSHRDWKVGDLYFLKILFQRNGPQVLKKETFLSCKCIKLLTEVLHMKGTEKEFTSPSFLK